MKRTACLFAILAICCFALFALFAIIMWPPFTSKEVELTGLSFELSELAFFDDTGVRGEGHRIWIYQIPHDAAQRLSVKEYPLSQYPMWCGLAIDGYQRIRWTPSNSASAGDLPLVLKSVLGNASPTEMEVATLKTMHDARRFAAALISRDGTLVAGWYTVVDGRMVTNYFVYVMNLDKEVVVKLSLLT